MNNFRYCGNCTLCCSVLAIPELNKERGKACPYISSDGCSIYSERPEVCEGFHCLWQHKDVFKDKKGILRPDRLGVVIIHRDHIEGYSPATELIALKASAFASSTVKQLVRSLTKNGLNVALVSAANDMNNILIKAGECI